MAVEYLARGVHTVATRLRGKVTSTFGCHLKHISSETQLHAPSSIPPTLKPHLIAYPPRLKPDLVSFIDGSTLLFGDYISLPVLNTRLSYLSSIAINIANDGTKLLLWLMFNCFHFFKRYD